MSTLLTIEDLSVDFPIGGELRPILRDVSVAIAQGESVGLVGESGSGKSTTLRALARLLPPAAEISGRIDFDGSDVLSLRGEGLRRFRARELAIVFQDPRAAINPVHTIGDALTDSLRRVRGVKRAEAERRALALLDQVGIPGGAQRLRRYPHELSGGMLQRVMLAASLVVEPRLLLADEPTASLDVTTQSDVMGLIDDLRHDRGLAMLFVTHDLELAAAVCDRTYVMYAGEIVESQSSARLHETPLHPYTAGLLGARPSVDSATERLAAIPGRPLSAVEAPSGCRFASRCIHCKPRCEQEHPELVPCEQGLVACLRAPELRRVLTSSPIRTGNG